MQLEPIKSNFRMAFRADTEMTHHDGLSRKGKEELGIAGWL